MLIFSRNAQLNKHNLICDDKNIRADLVFSICAFFVKKLPPLDDVDDSSF